MEEKDLAHWAANYSRKETDGRLLYTAVRDGVEVVHSFPLDDGPDAPVRVRMFREMAAQLVLDALEGMRR